MTRTQRLMFQTGLVGAMAMVSAALPRAARAGAPFCNVYCAEQCTAKWESGCPADNHPECHLCLCGDMEDFTCHDVQLATVFCSTIGDGGGGDGD